MSGLDDLMNKDMKECPVCHSMMPVDQTFCTHCGTKLEVPKAGKESVKKMRREETQVYSAAEVRRAEAEAKARAEEQQRTAAEEARRQEAEARRRADAEAERRRAQLAAENQRRAHEAAMAKQRAEQEAAARNAGAGMGAGAAGGYYAGQQQGAQGNYSGYDERGAYGGYNEPPKKKSKIWIPILIVILAAAAGIGGFFVFSHNNSGTEIDLVAGITNDDFTFTGTDGMGSISFDSEDLVKKADISKESNKTKEFMKTVYFEADTESFGTGLSNGDRVLITAYYDKDMAEEYNIEITDDDKYVTVSGLEKASSESSESMADVIFGTNNGDLYTDGSKVYDYSTVVLSSADVKKWTDAQIQKAINDIYAKNGYTFTTKEWKAYYESKGFKGDTSDQEKAKSRFTSTELHNVEILQNEREARN